MPADTPVNTSDQKTNISGIEIGPLGSGRLAYIGKDEDYPSGALLHQANVDQGPISPGKGMGTPS